MSSFWGVEVKPEKPYTHTHSLRIGRLRLTQATLGSEVGKVEKRKKSVVQVQCTVKDKDPVILCALVPGQSETCHLEFEFEEKYVTFSVLGPRSVHLAGYHLGDLYGPDFSESDTGSDSLRGSDNDGFLDTDDDDNPVIVPASPGDMSTDSFDDDSDYDSESDDVEMMYNKRRGKSSVVIEEIQEDDKPAGGEGQKGSKKKQSSENGDNSLLQLAVRTPPAESLESEDEDGFPVSFSESKNSAEGGSKKNKNLNNEMSNKDRKRKSGAISDHRDSSGEVNIENDGAKKKAKDKRTVVDSEKVNSVEKESKQDSPADPVDAKQKKKKSKNVSASEPDIDQQADKKNHSNNDAEELSAQGAKKKKKNKKKKAQEKDTSENQAQTDLMESDGKEQTLQTRTFGNGLIIEAVAMGKPDGKKASPGKKVSVKYIGKLTNGKIFDSAVGGRSFEFRLGVGQVIKGWDIGINGMRIGDKRRLTIPPSMGYGNQKVGTIPQNSTLVFDVELVNVK